MRTLAFKVSILLAVSCIFAVPVWSEEIPAQYQEVLRLLGRSGDYENKVLKVGIPRADLEVTIQGRPVPTALGFSGWVAMTEGEHGAHVLMGDLVLLQEEVNPVMSALLKNEIEVTALHNHFFWEEPRIFYMHIHAHGDPLELAKRVRPALDLIGKNTAKRNPLREQTPPGKLDTKKLSEIIGHEGTQTGPVYKFTIGREDFVMKEHGAVIDARMGLNTWAAFTGTDGDAVIAGDVAMLEHEVTPVLKALRRNGIEVVATHHHMTEVRPVIIFLHYWGRGPAAQLAGAFRKALDELVRGSARTTPHL